MPEFGFDTTGAEVINAFSDQISGKTILITGPTPGGLGARVAEHLCSHPTQKPACIMLLGRSLPKIEPLISKLHELSPNTTFHFIPIDLSSLSSVRTAATAIKSLSPKIDILLNNAGIMALHTYTTSVDGIEMQFATNHIGHFLLTNLLLTSTPTLFAPSSRLINISSAGHALGPARFPSPSTPMTPDTALEAVNFAHGKQYDEWAAYGQGKCANILFARSLALKLSSRNIHSFSLHPGNIFGTGLGANLVDPNWAVVAELFEKAGRTPPGIKGLEEGCSTILCAVLDPGLSEFSGAFLDDCKPSTSTAFASDMENAERLWEVSEVIVGEKFEYLSSD